MPRGTALALGIPPNFDNMETTPITLDENHVYSGRGKHPSVSQVLDLYFPPSPYYTEDGRERGKARHIWYEAIARGSTIANEPDPRFAGEVAAFRKFMAEVKPKIILLECPMFDDALLVYGTPDLYCEINSRPSVCDFKPSTAKDRWRIQTAAYQSLLAANGFPVLDRYALRLLDGSYRLDAHKEKSDLACWRAFVPGFKALQEIKCRTKS